jgi:hypothetical protein
MQPYFLRSPNEVELFQQRHFLDDTLLKFTELEGRRQYHPWLREGRDRTRLGTGGRPVRRKTGVAT